MYHIELDSKTSEKELDFYYFQMHDFDNNLVLDGLEILTAMNHVIDTDYLRAKTETQKTSTIAPKDDMTDDEDVDPMEYYHIRERYRNQIRWNQKFDEDSKVIDHLLKEYDKDNDGFISYTEYIIARREKHK
ncbi:multiple coagulation factor deficiency protein 2 homolog [Oppia nitens]|uniref:multiple coagulation factor deficiency protein 2 homolog n=1 Tax=Oppia nitens TaxID=1686743 RepID=UPI0023DC09E7|nr:multiple coagulation factor deficiency protein 2 homolog [Oppia nitens]